MDSGATGAPAASHRFPRFATRGLILGVLGLLAIALLVAIAGDATAAPLSGANANLARACATPSTGLVDRTTAATDTTVSDLLLANDALNLGSSATYFGTDYVFNELTINIGVGGTSGSVAWAYWNGAWSSLSVTDGTSALTATGANTVSWTPPSDWAQREIDATACPGSRYYVRLTNGATNFVVVPLATQVSGQVFNAKVKVQDELATVQTGLASGAFTVAGGSDNTLYSFREIGSGVYELALDTAGADVNFDVKSAKDGYVTSAALATGTLSGGLTDLTGSALSLNYAYKVSSITSERSVALTGGTVSAGDSFGTSCSESGGAYYCPVPLANTGVAARFVKDGYVTNSATNFASDRTSATDAQVAASITNVLYTLKITLPTELDLSGVTIERKIGAGSYASVTPEATLANVAYVAQSTGQADLVFRATKYSVSSDTGSAFTATASTQTSKTLSLVASLSSLATSAGNTAAGAQTTYTFTSSLAHSWPLDGKFKVTLPAGYLIGAPAVTLTGASGTASASVSGQVLTITRAADGALTPAGTSVSIALTQITNPGTSGSSGTFAATLLNAADVDLDTGTLPSISITAGSLNTLTTTPTSTVSGATTAYGFSMRNVNPWPATGKLAITFPSGFTIGSPSVTLTGATGTATATVSGLTVTIARSGDGAQTAGSTTIGITLTQITNPSSTGATGTYALNLRSVLDTDIDTGSAPAVTITVGALTGLTTTASSDVGSAASAYSFRFVPASAWPANGKLQITFPGGFGYGTLTATVTGATGTATASAASGVVTVTRANNGAQTSAGTSVTVTISGLTNPSSDGTPGVFALSLQDGAGVAINTGTAPAFSIATHALSVRNLASPSHSLSVWRPANSISLSWTSPADTTFVGFSWALDAQPDDVVDGAGYSFSSAVVPDGIHSFNIKAKNAAGAWGPTATIANLYVDAGPPVPPTVSSTTFAPGVCTQSTAGAFSWVSTDAVSGLDSALPYAYAVDGATPTRTSSTALSLSALRAGSHTLAVYAYDRAGNNAKTSYAFRIDTTGPDVNVTAPAATRSTSIELGVTATDLCSKVASITLQYRFGTGEWRSVPLPGTATKHTFTAAQGDGSYSFRAWGTDALGLLGPTPSAAQATTILDRVAPGAPSSSASQALWDGTVRVSWSSAADNGSGVLGYNVYRSLLGAAGTKTNARPLLASPFIDASPLQGVAFQYAVAAVDKAGNEGPRSVLTAVLRLDEVARLPAPSALEALGLEDSVLASVPVSLTWPAVAGASGYRVYASLDPAFSADATIFLDEAPDVRFVVENPPEGEQSYAVVALDEAGAEGHPAFLTLWLDTLPPSSHVRAPAEAGPGIVLEWNASDAGAGVDLVELWAIEDAGAPRRFFVSPDADGSASFFGRRGHVYHFYSIAVDRLGRVEERNLTLAEAQAMTRVVSDRAVAGAGALDRFNATFGLSLRDAFYATDADGDGFPESFVDPNGLLSARRSVALATGHRVLLLQANDTRYALWNAATDQVDEVALQVPLGPPEASAGAGGTLVAVVRVDKGEWILVPSPDVASGRAIQEVRRGDGSLVPSDYVWRENGKVMILDDPSEEYRIVYAPEASRQGIPFWLWTALGTPLLLGAAILTWIEAPGLEHVRQARYARDSLRWATCHCRRCHAALPRSERILRSLHQCGGFAHRVRARRHSWLNAGLAEKLRHAHLLPSLGPPAPVGIVNPMSKRPRAHTRPAATEVHAPARGQEAHASTHFAARLHEAAQAHRAQAFGKQHLFNPLGPSARKGSHSERRHATADGEQGGRSEPKRPWKHRVRRLWRRRSK